MFKIELDFQKKIEPYQFEPCIADIERSVEPLFTNDPAIDELNLDRVIVKSMDSYSGYGWDADTAFQLANLYRAFLFLCKTYPTEVIVPIKEIDEFWHMHILDTRNYIADCYTVFGYYLHHFPYVGLNNSSISMENEDIFKMKTLELVEKHFPQLLPDK